MVFRYWAINIWIKTSSWIFTLDHMTWKIIRAQVLFGDNHCTHLITIKRRFIFAGQLLFYKYQQFGLWLCEMKILLIINDLNFKWMLTKCYHLHHSKLFGTGKQDQNIYLQQNKFGYKSFHYYYHFCVSRTAGNCLLKQTVV